MDTRSFIIRRASESLPEPPFTRSPGNTIIEGIAREFVDTDQLARELMDGRLELVYVKAEKKKKGRKNE